MTIHLAPRDPHPDVPSGAGSAPAWARGFQDLTREHGFEPLEVEGALPADLLGTVYYNGPSLFSSQGERYAHWFDGDGGVAAARFENGRALGAARVVASSGLLEERRAGRRLYGGYGTPQPGFLNRLRGRIKNAANTSVMLWNRRLFALYEASMPTELAPEDLITLGETELGVIIQTFSAHPHEVPARNAWYGFGVRSGARPMIDLFELPHGGPARYLGTVPMPGQTLVHDFMVTARHFVILAPPVRLRQGRYLLGRGSLADNLVWEPARGTDVIVIPIDEPILARRFTVDPFFQWHFANAFEHHDALVVDLVRYPDFGSSDWLGELVHGRSDRSLGSSLVRAIIDPHTSRFAMEERWSRPCEFPQVAPVARGRDYAYCYVTAHSARAEGRGLQDTIARVDMRTGAVREHWCGPGRYPSEPLFVPRAGGAGSEDDGYLLSLIYDAGTHTSHCAVLDARDIEAGPLARAHFDHHVPPRFHGAWMPASSYPLAEPVR